MNCATCNRSIDEHTAQPDMGHPTTGCKSFAFSFRPDVLERLEGIADVLKRRAVGEIIIHCHCLRTADLKPCSNCGYLLCSADHARHEENCSLPQDSRHPGMPYSQPNPLQDHNIGWQDLIQQTCSRLSAEIHAAVVHGVDVIIGVDNGQVRYTALTEMGDRALRAMQATLKKP